MATSLGKVGIVNKGNYSAEVVYNSGDFVLYEGSTWLALKDNLLGVEPGEGENWKYLARGVPENIQDEIDSIKNNKLDKTEFDNLTIGGRNLAKETNQGSKNWGWSLETGNRIVESEIVDGINCVKLTKTEDVLSGGWNFVFYKNFERNRIKPSTEYVLSFEVRSNKVLSINADLTKKNGTDYLTETSKVLQGKVDGNNTWTKVVFLLKTYSKLPTPTDQVIYLRGFNAENGAVHYIRNLMLEEGNKPSNWTPAPEDFQDQINSIQNPVFDDSGTTEGINSFTDFMNSVKSKMNIFQFFRDFKSGMKYIMHTGRLANNATTTQEGFALDARMGKTLQDQITDVNKNITRKIDLNSSGFFVGGANNFAFLQIKQDQNVTRLQIEANKAAIYKSTDGAISFPTCEKLLTNSDIISCEIDFGEILLSNGVTVKSYDFPAKYPNYKFISAPQPMVYYTHNLDYAQITFAGYYDPSGELRIYCDRTIKARIAIKCLVIAK